MTTKTRERKATMVEAMQETTPVVPPETPQEKATRLKAEYQAAMKLVRGITRKENVQQANAAAQEIIAEVAAKLPGAILERSGRNLKALTLRIEAYEDESGNRKYQTNIRVRTVRAKIADNGDEGIPDETETEDSEGEESDA